MKLLLKGGGFGTYWGKKRVSFLKETFLSATRSSVHTACSLPQEILDGHIFFSAKKEQNRKQLGLSSEAGGRRQPYGPRSPRSARRRPPSAPRPAGQGVGNSGLSGDPDALSPRFLGCRQPPKPAVVPSSCRFSLIPIYPHINPISVSSDLALSSR